MNKHLEVRKHISTIFVAVVLGTLAFATPAIAQSENAAEKVRLMAEALRARDTGDLALAKARAEEINRLTPGDKDVERLLESIDREITSQGGISSTASTGSVNSEQELAISQARQAIPRALKLANRGNYTSALNVLESRSAALPVNSATRPVLDQIERTKSRIIEMRANSFLIDSASYDVSIEEVSPEFVAQSEIIDELLAKGRIQYLNGDYDGAATTFKEVEAREPNNAEAKLFQTRIAEILGDVHVQNFYKTREQMLTEVDQNWERPKVFDVDKEVNVGEVEESGILQQMKNIVIPQVNFSGMELTRVVETLSELSVEYDPTGIGVNIVPLFDANETNPQVNISLRNLNLDLILKFVTQQVDFSYDVGNDAVTVSQTDSNGGESSNLTEFFPISRATIIRLVGIPEDDTSSVSTDPFADPVGNFDSGASDDADSLKTFFQSAGVNFDLPGVDLAFDGEQLIVTQTPRNLERMRVILRNYNEIKQVEIEAKFLEVSQGDLEEIGFDWSLTKRGETIFQFGEAIGTPSQFGARTLADQFAASVDENAIQILQSGEASPAIPFNPPGLPNTIDLAADGLSLSTLNRAIELGAYDADFAIRALSRKTGSDLMSAPKVTVLSGKRATITVAQELLYPESYGDIEAEVSAGVEDGGTGGAGIAITAGTPQDFISRNVGVEMSVTPNVENDDTISLILEPRVTEFEGFVEYGGPSVAIQGGTTVTVPSGFYQPIFSTRQVTTEVTVFDGATIVMGGLTRDEVKTIKDKVPVLGDIPGLGRLFRSEGETRLKRNLLIFVTANLVSPGGSPANQSYRNVNANSLFQNPTIMTPSGTVNRSIESD